MLSQAARAATADATTAARMYMTTIMSDSPGPPVCAGYRIVYGSDPGAPTVSTGAGAAGKEQGVTAGVPVLSHLSLCHSLRFDLREWV